MTLTQPENVGIHPANRHFIPRNPTTISLKQKMSLDKYFKFQFSNAVLIVRPIDTLLYN